MASEDTTVGEVLVKLASIPKNLRGTTWLTISESALVVSVSDAILSSVLERFRSDNLR